MSPDVIAFLLDLLNRQTLNAGAPDFDAAVSIVQKTRAELVAEMDRVTH